MVIARAVLVLAALTVPAAAKGWPTPAAGESASGDIEVLFTFDDGPNPKTTPQVLDILAAHHIHAVFFLLGERIKDSKVAPKLIDRMLREGHIIANHTFHHYDLCKKPEDVAEKDIDDGKATIEANARMKTQWFRAPGGAHCDRLDKMLADRHIAHFHWDLDPQEWKKKDHNLEKTVKYVQTELTRAGGRVVLLMHDVKEVTVEALPQILAFIDEENARREKSRKMKIHVLQSPQLAAERLPAGLVGWLDEATAGVRALPDTFANLLP
jgi:peptidoglycan-N-acetylglucosamine deacetylase